MCVMSTRGQLMPENIRNQIEGCSDRIYALGKMVELVKELGPDDSVDTQAIGECGSMISYEVCKLMSHLNDAALVKENK